MSVAISFNFKMSFNSKEDLKKVVELFNVKNTEKLKKEGKIDDEMIGIIRMMHSNEETMTISGFEDERANIDSDRLFFTLLEIVNKEIINLEYTAESLCIQEDEGYGEKSKYWFEHGEMKSECNTGKNVWVDNDELAGVIVAVTGKLEGFSSREDFKKLVEKFGGKVANTITKKVEYLITDDPDCDSSKIRKAEELGIEILNPCEFFDIYGIALEDDEDDWSEEDEDY
jgi:NAD-dependent DNA ligase